MCNNYIDGEANFFFLFNFNGDLEDQKFGWLLFTRSFLKMMGRLALSVAKGKRNPQNMQLKWRSPVISGERKKKKKVFRGLRSVAVVNQAEKTLL